MYTHTLHNNASVKGFLRPRGLLLINPVVVEIAKTKPGVCCVCFREREREGFFFFRHACLHTTLILAQGTEFVNLRTFHAP